MRRRVAYLICLSALLTVACGATDWGAAAILHPWHRPVLFEPDLPCETIAFESDGLRLEGWLFRAPAPQRGLIVYLHGIADNRQSGLGVARRFVPLGYDVLAYDSRAHGRSQGDFCTYGYFERRDVTRALDAVGAKRAVLFGSSLGAAVALQAAAVDPRVIGVISQSSFADLPSIVRDRAPWYLPEAYVTAAIARAGERAGFPPSEASPVAAAARIHVPVLLIHGAADDETPCRHSQHIFDALAGAKRLLLVPGAGHNDVLAREEVWQEIERFCRRISETGDSAQTRGCAR
jgi:pimeloyl-ACP methyl ester carboxylesterase